MEALGGSSGHKDDIHSELAAGPRGLGAGPSGWFSFPGGFPLAGAVAPGKGRCAAPWETPITPALVPSRSVTLGKTSPSSVCSLMNRNEEDGPDAVEGSTFQCEVWDTTRDPVGWGWFKQRPPSAVLQSRPLHGWGVGLLLFRKLRGKPGFALALRQRREQQFGGWTPSLPPKSLLVCSP